MKLFSNHTTVTSAIMTTTTRLLPTLLEGARERITKEITN